jgi:6-phosphogluconolactonase
VFVINELDSTLSTLAYDPSTGALRLLQTVSTLPADFDGPNTTAAIVASPSGRFVFGSNRGHDSVAIFRVEPDTATLTQVGHTPTQGRVPRDVNVDPTGALLLAANQDSDSIVLFRINQATGELTPTGHAIRTPRPVRIVFGGPQVDSP